MTTPTLEVIHIDHTDDADAADYAYPTGWYVYGIDENGVSVDDELSGPFDTAEIALRYGQDQIDAAQ